MMYAAVAQPESDVLEDAASSAMSTLSPFQSIYA